METRALTIRQPWAALIMMGRKTIETRTKTTTRRGRVFIHAATTMGPAERAAAIREGLDPDALPRGAILGSVEIVASTRVEDLQVTDAERRCGDYRPGRWGWTLAAVRALATTVPCAGALSFWRLPDDVGAEVERQGHERVFVYGTLKRGHGNHRLLTVGGRYLGPAQIKGNMHDLGGCPAVNLDGGGVVHGELYDVTAETLARLDLLEGVPSFYQRTRVSMSTGELAWVYVMERDRLASKRWIASGRWER